MFSLIIPVYNEEGLIDELASRSVKALESFTPNYEILFINDGSTDSTLQKLIEVRNRFSRIKIVDLSKNFGHQAAFTAGLEMATGNYVAMMDGDLQDPPELLAEMYRLIKDEGFDIVSGKRNGRKGKRLRITTNLFHAFFKKVAGMDDMENSGNFSVMNRAAVNALVSMKETIRYLPGLRAFIGFNQGYVEYVREERVEGEPKMTLGKLMVLGADAIFSFSKFPIKVCLYLGTIGAIVMLSAMLLISRDAGISGDEAVHYKHSEMVYNYFSTLGNDKSSLHTPKTHLQYYGQASDNLVTMLIHGFGIEDIYGFRHFMSSFFGWLAILVTALFAAWLAGYGAAIWVLILFALSPTFLGHVQNNLKDIPFALAYISSIYYSLKLVFSETKPTRQTILLLILSIAFSIGIRIGGVLVVFYLGFFMFMKTVLDWISNKKLNPELLKKQLILFVGISLAGYLLGLIIWPYALQNPWLNPWKSFQVMTHFPTTVRQIFEGRFDWSDFHPWYYLPKYMAITIPFIVFSGIVAFFLNIRKNYSSDQKLKLFMLGFTILFPIIFVILKKSNLYGSWRHFLFVYPGIILISALGIHAFLVRFKHRIIRIAAILLLLVLSVHPLRFMAANHPYYYLYYNQFTGGLKGAYGNYETDYYYHSMRGGAEWLQEYLKNKPNGSEIIVGGNFPIKWYFRKDKTVKFVYFPYQRRSEYNWDYAIIANSI